jgi:hypothetical protein
MFTPSVGLGEAGTINNICGFAENAMTSLSF